MLLAVILHRNAATIEKLRSEPDNLQGRLRQAEYDLECQTDRTTTQLALETTRADAAALDAECKAVIIARLETQCQAARNEILATKDLLGGARCVYHLPELPSLSLILRTALAQSLQDRVQSLQDQVDAVNAATLFGDVGAPAPPPPPAYEPRAEPMPDILPSTSSSSPSEDGTAPSTALSTPTPSPSPATPSLSRPALGIPLRARAQQHADAPAPSPSFGDHFSAAFTFTTAAASASVNAAREFVQAAWHAQPEDDIPDIRIVPGGFFPSSNIDDDAPALSRTEIVAETLQTITRAARRGDHYAVLGVEADATVAELTRAHRRLVWSLHLASLLPLNRPQAVLVHPDKLPLVADTGARNEAPYRLVQESFALLCDTRARRAYDGARTEAAQQSRWKRFRRS